MNVLDNLINEERKNYLCFDLLKKLYNEKPSFKRIIDQGFENGEVVGFPEELWNRIDDQNVRGIDSFEQIFKEGYNIGGCTVVSKQLSYSFDSCTLCSGLLPLIEGTKNSPIGEHSWMQSGGIIYDTTLMLCLTNTIAEQLGYQKEVEYNPHTSNIYMATYEFTNDPSFKTKKR